MQQQVWTKSIGRMKWYTALFLLIIAVCTAGCQQPAKPLITEKPLEKSAQSSTGSKKEKDKVNEKAKDNGKDKKEENKTPENNQQPNQDQNQNQSGMVTYQGLAIPLTLSRSPQELNKRIINEIQLNPADSGAILNAQGKVVKYVEKEVEYDITAAFDDNILLDPSHNSIYPGAVLVGSSIDDGSYREITNGSKREARISFSLQGVKDKEKGGTAGITSGKIIPSLAAYRELHNKVLSQSVTYHASAHFNYEEIEIKDEESFQTQFKLGVGFAAAGIKSKIAAGFKFKEGDNLHRHLITFSETFYTVDVDQENVPLMLDIPRDVVGDRMPVYVSSISYGRIAYLTIESKKTWEELKPSFETALKRGTTNIGEVDFNAAIDYLESNAFITINVIGGSGEAVTKLPEFQKYIVKGGFSSGNPGQIIKYQLRFLDDNATAHIKYAGSYKTVERTEVPAKGYEISAMVKNVRSTCPDFLTVDVVGSIGIQPQGRKDLRKMIFQHDGTAGHPKLPVIKTEQVNGNLTHQTASIVIPQDTPTTELVFDIKTEVEGEADRAFEIKNSVNKNVALVSGFPNTNLPNTKFTTITLCRKGFPDETLIFDIEFEVKEVE